MGPSEWIALVVGVAATVLGALPFVLRRSDRQRVENDLMRRENQALRDSNWDLKLQLATLQGRLGQVVDQTFGAIPRAPERREGSGGG